MLWLLACCGCWVYKWLQVAHARREVCPSHSKLLPPDRAQLSPLYDITIFTQPCPSGTLLTIFPLGLYTCSHSFASSPPDHAA